MYGVEAVIFFLLGPRFLGWLRRCVVVTVLRVVCAALAVLVYPQVVDHGLALACGTLVNANGRGLRTHPFRLGYRFALFRCEDAQVDAVTYVVSSYGVLDPVKAGDTNTWLDVRADYTCSDLFTATPIARVGASKRLSTVVRIKPATAADMPSGGLAPHTAAARLRRQARVAVSLARARNLGGRVPAPTTAAAGSPLGH